ncbi:MAG: hypothetical protein BZ138_02905 [Methanosphaera sp. rholeuAM270]|nr:MAG: hypothetical protein BZ138_02905 [Methanosphaera sp. rholeuAM270]
MTKLLLLCHDIPSMSVGATLPIYHLIKHLGKKYEIHLISFDSKKYNIEDIEECLMETDTLNIPEYLNIKDQLIYTSKNMISFDNIGTRSFLNYYYHPDMKKLIQKSLQDADLIITDMPMAFYVKDVDKAKIVYAFDAVSDYNHKMYQKAESMKSKIYWYLNYLKIHNYEKCYNNFDSCILVNEKDKKILENDITTKIEVIANGVDTEYFRNTSKEKSNKIIFLGDMSTPPNNDAVKYFMKEIYPKVMKKKTLPLYIVGRNPTEYVEKLGENANVTVTGTVNDVRTYLTRGTIFVTPMISGTGIKNKILEAMSMNLAVVSTSCGINGISARDNHEFLLADDPDTFAENIIKLSENDELYERLANNAREFVENSYSWENSMNKIEKIIKRIST